MMLVGVQEQLLLLVVVVVVGPWKPITPLPLLQQQQQHLEREALVVIETLAASAPQR
jgi:hypothetical protein